MSQDGTHVKEAMELLRQRGCRMTPQRLMILTAVQASETHISAEEIYTQVSEQYPSVNRSTVYRTLELLRNLGLVTETDLGEGVVRYHAAEKGRHHHLICQKCGAIQELDDALLQPLKEALTERYQFQANLDHFAIFGRCYRCR